MYLLPSTTSYSTHHFASSRKLVTCLDEFRVKIEALCIYPLLEKLSKASSPLLEKLPKASSPSGSLQWNANDFALFQKINEMTFDLSEEFSQM